MSQSAKMGRPSLVNNDAVVDIVLRLTAKGKTLAEIADVVGVSERALYRWQESHDDFRQALKDARAKSDDQVEAALFRKAIGAVIEEDVFVVDKFGTEHRGTIKKELAPDSTACIFWLKNRQPDKWRDKIMHEGNPESPIVFAYPDPQKEDHEDSDN